MKFPSTEYNAYSKFSGAKGTITTWTDEDRLVLIATSDVLAEVDVDVLARAFNIDNAKFLGRVIEVDKFENDEIQAVLCDEAWLQIYDNLLRFDEFYNARVMAWNEYLHAWGTYAICPFANAVVLATSVPKPATAISLSNGNIVGAEVGDEVDGSVTTTPADATSEMSYRSDNDAIATIEEGLSNKAYVVKAVGLGDTTLYVSTDNGITKSFTISVTTLPATSISFGAEDVEVDAGSSKILALTSVPENANDEVTFSIPEGNTSYLTIEKIDNKHVRLNGVGATASDITLTATTSKSKTATIDVSVVSE